jgi:uncharacterized protein YcbK (DUF882 family)
MADAGSPVSDGDVKPIRCSPVPDQFARQYFLSLRTVRAGRYYSRYLVIAAVLLIAANDGLQTATAESDTRTLSFHHVHTGQDLTITFKRNGQYDDTALTRLNWFLRDWRRDEDIKMDPQLFDLLWQAYRDAGGSEPIQVISGYRSPKTNAMLRARSSGVAQGSLHTHGQAMDFFIPGVSLEKIREVGLKMQRGGVGFYPTSGSPFVHLDTGTIRHWPRMTRDQLVKVFPNERTVHIPADDQPLAGYTLALAEVERSGHAPSNVSLAAARNASVIDDSDIETASMASPTKKPARAAPTLLASAFGFKPGMGEPEATKPETTKAAVRAEPIVTASLSMPAPVAAHRADVPMPKMRPVAVAMLAPMLTPMSTPKPSPRPAAAAPVAVASLAANVFDARGMWPATEDAAADPRTSTRTGPVLAYAPSARAAAAVFPAPAGPTPITPAWSGWRTDSPWMRAVLLTPNTRSFMTVAQLGPRNRGNLRDMLRKPSSSVVMTFSDDPNYGVLADRFSGNAVTFLATATFGMRTAALWR